MAPPRLRIRLNSAAGVGTRSAREAAEREPRRRQQAEHDGDAAHDLRPDHAREVGLRRLERAHAETERRTARSRRGQQTGVDALLQRTATGAVSSCAMPVTSMIVADLQRAVSPHEGEEDRHQVDRAEQADAEDEAEEAADREVAVGEGAEIDDRRAAPRACAARSRSRRQRSARAARRPAARPSRVAAPPSARSPAPQGPSPSAPARAVELPRPVEPRRAGRKARPADRQRARQRR